MASNLANETVSQIETEGLIHEAKALLEMYRKDFSNKPRYKRFETSLSMYESHVKKGTDTKILHIAFKDACKSFKMYINMYWTIKSPRKTV